MSTLMLGNNNRSINNNNNNNYDTKRNQTSALYATKQNSNYNLYRTPKIKFKVWDTPFEMDAKYSPVKALGKGSYGVVCSSLDTSTNKMVAVKKISNIFRNVDEARKVLRELRILRQCRHENVVELNKVVISSSRYTFNDIYLVYELMDIDLLKAIHGYNPLTSLQIHFFMWQLIKGLNYLHAANILHRDLKPENLLVNEKTSTLKICDFGLSKAYQPGMSDYVGTLWYKAPEMLLHCPNYGGSVDVWSTGCIFAEMLGRKPLFAGNDSLDQLKQIIAIIGTPDDSDLDFIEDFETWKFIKMLPYMPGIRLDYLFPDAQPMALDLLAKMLVINPNRRITVAEITEHPYLVELYDDELLHLPKSHCDLDDIDVRFTKRDTETDEDRIRSMIWDEMLLYHLGVVD